MRILAECVRSAALVPALYGLGALQVEGVGDGLTRNRELQREAPGVQRCLHAWRIGLRWTRLEIVLVREERGDGRGDERGMQERLQGSTAARNQPCPSVAPTCLILTLRWKWAIRRSHIWHSVSFHKQRLFSL